MSLAMATVTVPARTSFGAILQRAVDGTPGAVGGAFADSQGELVDAYARGFAALDWAILTAHYGVIYAHLRDALGVWHFGGCEHFIAQHERFAIVVHAVLGGYYALLAVEEPTVVRGEPWMDRAQGALLALRDASRELAKEMM